ncbi:MAG TPA: hypothetical protein VI029_09375, partial [Mycobacterium sp.]
MANEGRRKWFNRAAKVGRTAQRIADVPANAVGRGQPISNTAKLDLNEKGVNAVATVMKAPSKHRITSVKENVGRFTVRIELTGEQPYEINVWQV